MLHDFAVAVATVVIAVSGAIANGVEVVSSALFPPQEPEVTFEVTPLPAATVLQPPGQVLAASTTTESVVATTTITKQYVTNNPVVERIVEREVFTTPLITVADLSALEARFNAKFAAFVSPALFPQQVGGGGFPSPFPAPPSYSQRIDRLDNVVLNNPTINGASIQTGSIVGTISNTINSLLATIDDLTSNTIVAVNASTTNLTVSATTTTNGLRVTALDCSSFGNGGTLTTDASGNVVCAADDGGAGGVGGSNAQVQFNDAGVLGGDAGLTYDKTADRLTVTNASTTSITATTASTTNLVISSVTSGLLKSGPSGIVALAVPGSDYVSSTAGDWTGTFDGIEGSFYISNSFSTTSADVWKANRNFFATTSADYWKTQNDFFSTTSASYFIAQNQGASFSTTSSDFWSTQRSFFSTTSVAYWQSVTDLFSTTSTSYFVSTYDKGFFFSTTSVNAWKLVTDLFSTTSADFLATQRNFFSTTSASYFLTQNPGLSFSTTSSDFWLTQKTTTNLTEGSNQYFTNARADARINATSTIGTLTSAPSLGTVTTSLTGFLKATAGVLSAALLDLTSDVSGILPVGNGGTGWANIASGAIPFGNGSSALATTTAGTPGQVLALLNGVPTWVATTTLSTISGALGVGSGGTGATTFSYGLLLSPGGTSAIANIATSSLGLLTTNVAEGSYLYWTDTRFDSRLSATTSLPNITTLANLSLPATQLSSFGVPFFNFFSATTTDALTQGATNRYYADSLVLSFIHASTTIPKTYSSNTFSGSNVFNGTLTFASLNGPLQANAGVLSATTSIGVLYGGTGLTNAPNYGQLLVGNSSGGYTLTATSSLGITGGSSLFTDGGNTTYLTSSDVLGIGTTTAWSKLAVYGDLFLEGSSRYLNFGTATGTSGYGFRDNAGTLEFKNSGGSWQGVTTATSGPSFSVHKNGTNQTVTTNTDTLLTWSTERYDTNNNFASNRFTPTVPGKYQVNVTVYCSDGAGACVTEIWKNGANYVQNYAPYANGQATVAAVVDMNGTTDYLEAYGYNGGGTTIGGATVHTQFSGALIAPVNATAGGWQNDNTQSFLADSTDLVGIGTSTPWAKLSIEATAGMPQFVIGSSTTQFIVDQNGNVGIGTTTPAYPLSVYGSGNTPIINVYSSTGNVSGVFQAAGTAGGVYAGSYSTHPFVFLTNSSERMRIDSSGNVGIGTTSPTNKLTVGGVADVSQLLIGETVNTFNGKIELQYSGNANYGIYFNDTRAADDSAGALNFQKNGSVVGSIVLHTSSTAYNTSSDRRVKENITTTTTGLDTLMRLSVRDFSFLSDPAHAMTTGFIAQELREVFPWAVTMNGDNGVDPLTGSSTPWSVDYGRITPLLAKSIQDLNLKLEDLATTTPDIAEGSFTSRFFSSLFTRLTGWFGDATNGIQNLYARVFKGEQLCLGDTCITETDLQAMLAGSAAGAPSSGEASGASGGQSAPEANDADDTSIPLDDDSDATATTSPAAANDNQPIADAENEPEVQEPTPEPAPYVVAEPISVQENPLPEPANDNPRPEQLPATGTE